LSEQIKGRVHVIRGDRAGNLWFGMESGAGLYRLRDGALTHYTTRDGLAGDSVGAIHQDRGGRLWVGTDRGLSRFTGAEFETPIEAEGLSSASIRDFYEDAAGVLWVGTQEQGIYRLAGDPKGTKVTRYTTEQGLHSDRIDLILEDDLGFFWMSCHLGYIRVRKQELEDFAAGRVSSITSTWFGKAHGLLNEENGAFAEPVGHGFKARDGKLWFATREGIAVVDPKAVPFNPTPPPVVIEECLLDRRPAEFENGLRISPGQENLEINYTALSLVKSEQIRFRYKLGGLDRDWVEAGTRRTAYYSHIPPGEYVFTVVAANSDGVWNTAGRSLGVVALPPFYRTWWFTSLAALSIIAAVFLAFRYRVAQLHRKHELQQAFSRQLIESQEQERKRIAAELHDGLGQNLILMRNWAALGLLQSEPEAPVREQLNDISTTAVQSLNEVREIIYNLRPSQLESVGLSDTIRYMLTQLASASGIQWLTEVAPLDGLFAPEQEVIFFRIVQECVNNLVKHARATEATALIEREGNTVHLTIEDNGRGFDPAAPGHKGFGLKGLHERVRMLDGQFTLESMPGKGTRISITFEGKRHAK
jgi:signal transduction histidine kinase